MAEAILNKLLPHVAVGSAGITAVIGEPADPIAVQLMRERGLDIGKHRAQQLVRWQCVNADLILTMDRQQKSEIENWYPVVRGKVFRVAEFTDTDIHDPYRRGRKEFERALASIDNGLNKWVAKMEAFK